MSESTILSTTTPGRIALGLEYEGNAFHGWQTQPGGRTVQDALEAALGAIAGVPVATTCAGRTDTGVHATSQVVHFDAPVSRPESAWVRGVNSHLPDGVAVRWAQAVPADFHARFSARGRRYRYLLLNRPVRPGLAAGRVGWFHLPLDVAKMQEAADLLLGEHDFSTFRAAECQAASPVKTLDQLDVSRTGEEIRILTSARSFLHHQVRSMVGSLMRVGEGRWSADDLFAALKAADRTRCGPMAPAAGLYLAAVGYESA